MVCRHQGSGREVPLLLAAGGHFLAQKGVDFVTQRLRSPE